MKIDGGVERLLAVETGVRKSGWAVFQDGKVQASGVVEMLSPHRLAPEVRIDYLMAALDDLTGRWRPHAIVLSRPDGIHRTVRALDLLNKRLSCWLSGQAARMAIYSTKEVRVAIAGHPKPTSDHLSYAIMRRLGLIGEDRATEEWAAIALGHYHLSAQAIGSGREMNIELER